MADEGVSVAKAIEECEVRWFQIALRTYFWMGVLNAAFCFLGLGSLLYTAKAKQEIELRHKQALADISKWEDYRREAIGHKYEAQMIWNRIQRVSIEIEKRK